MDAVTANGLIKNFLDSIPKHVNKLKNVDEYNAVSKFPKFKMTLDKYSVMDNGDGFMVTGRLNVPMYSVVGLPGWIAFVSMNKNLPLSEAYEQFLNAIPTFFRDFKLDEFIDHFKDFYLEFLNDNGLEESDFEYNNNQIRYCK